MTCGRSFVTAVPIENPIVSMSLRNKLNIANGESVCENEHIYMRGQV